MKKYSIGSWAFLFKQEPPTNDFHALVHKLGHLGYAGVELFGFAPHPNPDSHDTKEKRQKLRKMVVDHRLEFSAYTFSLWGHKIWSDPSGLNQCMPVFEKHAIFAEDLGIKTICLDSAEPVRRADALEPKLIFDRCVTAFDQCAKIAAQHGLTIAWEFEPCYAINKPGEIVALIDAVRSLGNTNFGALFDTCNAHVCSDGNALSLLQQLKGKITHLQLADSDGTLNEHGSARHLPLGQGVLNFDQLIPELLTASVPNDWWTIDLSFWPDAWNVAADSKRFLDKLRHKFAQ